MTCFLALRGIALATVAVALAAIPTTAVAQTRSPDAAALLEAAFPADGPGASVVVMLGGRMVYVGARGLADLEARRPITRETAFRLGSITKQFTAAVVLQLVAERKLSLDAPLSRFFPDWPPPGAGATVRQLLNHSSGLQDYTKIPGFMGTERTARRLTTADLVAVIRAAPSVSAPGTRWEYNNGGYAMLGAIIEHVTGQPWHVQVVERIGKPLGLRSLAYADRDIADPGIALGYSRDGTAYRPSRGVHISVAHAAGGLVASAGDLARWAKALHHGHVISPALYREMTSPARLADGSTQPYGFGLRMREIRGLPALVHGGAGRGTDTDSAYIPSADLYVAVLSNTDDPATDPSTLVRRLAASALGKPLPIPVRANVGSATIAPLLGRYAGERGPDRFFTRDGGLYIGRGDEEVEVFAAGGDRFATADGLTWLTVTRKPDGAHVMDVDRVELASPLRVVRAGPVPKALMVAAGVLTSYVGTYATEGPVLNVAVTADGRLAIGPVGQPPAATRAISDVEFRIDGTPMGVVFHPEVGRTDRLTLYRGARELHGKRVR